MIITHPLLFNAIVVFFIAFTTAWVMYVISSRQRIKMKNRLNQLEAENEALQNQVQELWQKRPAHSFRSTPVIALSSAAKAVN